MKIKFVFSIVITILFLIACGENDLIKRAPSADFSASETEIGFGDTITFRDKSENDPNTYYWYFEGGNPANSTLSSPTVTYSTIGEYSVTLTVYNNLGQDDITKDNYIKVIDNRVKIHGQVIGLSIPIHALGMFINVVQNLYANCTLLGNNYYEVMFDKTLLGKTGTICIQYSLEDGSYGMSFSPEITFQRDNEVDFTYAPIPACNN